MGSVSFKNAALSLNSICIRASRRFKYAAAIRSLTALPTPFRQCIALAGACHTPTESSAVSHGLTNRRLDRLKPMYIDAIRINKRPKKNGIYILSVVESESSTSG